MDPNAQQLINQLYNQLQQEQQKSSTQFYDQSVSIKTNYHISKRIDGNSRGIYSQIRLAHYRQSKSRVAVKSYFLGDAQVENNNIIFQKRPGLSFNLIYNEITTLAQVEHSNIIRLFEVYYDGKFIHLVTELCRGGELYDLLLRQKQLPEKRAFSLAGQILDGLAYLHKENFAHRGLCIENIMFSDRERTIIKIISFGSSGQGNQFTERYGNPLYMAPEIFDGTYDKSCDIWSFGIILFTMLFGFQPFQHNDLAELIKLVQRAQLPKPSGWKNCTNQTKKMIKSILRREHRATAAELLQNSLIIQNRENLQSSMQSLLKKSGKLQQSNDSPIIQQLVYKMRFELYQRMLQENIITSVDSNLDQLFKSIDVSNTGQITREELTHSLMVQYQDQDDVEERVSTLIEKIDIKKQGFITYDEFMSALHPGLQDNEILLSLFETFESSDSIKIHQLAEITNTYDDQGWSEVRNIYDLNQSGSISKENFIRLMTSFS